MREYTDDKGKVTIHNTKTGKTYTGWPVDVREVMNTDKENWQFEKPKMTADEARKGAKQDEELLEHLLSLDGDALRLEAEKHDINLTHNMKNETIINKIVEAVEGK